MQNFKLSRYQEVRLFAIEYAPLIRAGPVGPATVLSGHSCLTTLYSTTLYSTTLYSTTLYSTTLYSTTLYSTTSVTE